jgi:O-antigen/teichoic acid export membrane protein
MLRRLFTNQIGAVLTVVAISIGFGVLWLLAAAFRWVFDNYGLAAGLTVTGLFTAAILVWALWLDKRRPLPPQPTADQWLGLRPKQTDPTRSDGSD